ncbi:hypothetical protein [Streptomyces sp. NPDC026673]|uniref:hypothetical protein n=1 Tax=Streptomyces sp. NPDC026673 TaxID=3155724 RepID=UPI0033EA7AEE
MLVVQEADATGVIDPFGDRVSAQGAIHNGVFTLEYERRLDAEYDVVQADFVGDFGAAPSGTGTPLSVDAVITHTEVTCHAITHVTSGRPANLERARVVHSETWPNHL